MYIYVVYICVYIYICIAYIYIILYRHVFAFGKPAGQTLSSCPRSILVVPVTRDSLQHYHCPPVLVKNATDTKLNRRCTCGLWSVGCSSMHLLICFF